MAKFAEFTFLLGCANRGFQGKAFQTPYPQARPRASADYYCPSSAARQPSPWQVSRVFRRETNSAGGAVASYLLVSSKGSATRL
jgi:hypothetical protein